MGTLVVEVTMILTIRKIAEGASEQDSDIEFGPQTDARIEFSGKIKVHAHIDRFDQGLSVECTYEGYVVQSCSRCLEDAQVPCNGTVHLSIPDKTQGNVTEFANDEYPEFLFDDDHFDIDVTPAIIDDIIIWLPMKPLCSAKCPGIDLPKKSGTTDVVQDLDDGTKKTEIDPRWAALQKLVKNSQRNSSSN